jgi:hypothetical protein
MKGHFLTLITLFTCCSCFSQSAIVPDYKWSIGLQVNTVDQTQRFTNQTTTIYWRDDDDLYISGNNTNTKDHSFDLSILGNYYMKDSRFIKSSFGVNQINIKSEAAASDSSGNSYLFNSSKKQTDFDFCGGFGWLTTSNKISFYGGFQFRGAIYGKAFVHKYYEWDDPAGAFYFSNEVLGTIKNGFSIGVGNFVGFLYRQKNIGIGGEISYSLMYSKYGGEESFDNLTKTTPASINENTVQLNPILKTFEISRIKASLNFQIFF